MSVRDIYVLHIGDIEIDRRLFLPSLAAGSIDIIPVPAYLLDTTDGWVLIDTGQHEAHIKDPGHTWRGTDAAATIVPVMEPPHSLVAQLALLGLGPTDIAYVINTHLHYDHCGENRLFPERPIFVAREHYQAAIADPAYPSQYFDVPGLTYELIDGDGSVLDGIDAVLSPGHALGLMALVVTLPGGEVVICGDAIPMREIIEQDEWDGFADPMAARMSAIALLRLAADHDAVVLYGHDVQQWSRLPRAPAALTVDGVRAAGSGAARGLGRVGEAA